MSSGRPFKRANAETREAWLEAAVTALRPRYATHHIPLPDRVRVSVGWPGGRKRKNVIGECWVGEAARDGLVQIFVSPVIDDPVTALAVLCHELVHAAGAHGHRRPFTTYAAAVGLHAPWTATTPGPDLTAALTALTTDLGPFPHAALQPATQERKQTTRMVKCECPGCGYTVRTTLKWLDLGAPICPACQVPMTADGAPADDGPGLTLIAATT